MKNKLVVEGLYISTDEINAVRSKAEKYLQNICYELSFDLLNEVIIKIIYPYESFNNVLSKKLNIKNLPNWIAGMLIEETIYIASPSDPGPYHTPQTVLDALCHELVHLCIYQNKILNKFHITWFEEGLANFLAKPIRKKTEQIIKMRIKQNKLPTLEQLDSNFVKKEGYHFAPTIFVTLSKLKKYRKSIRTYLTSTNSEEFYSGIKLSRKELELKWHNHLKEIYKKDG